MPNKKSIPYKIFSQDFRETVLPAVATEGEWRDDIFRFPTEELAGSIFLLLPESRYRVD